MKKTIPILLLFFFAVVSVQASGAAGDVSGEDAAGSEKTTVKLVVPSGATLVPIALLDKDSIADGYSVDLEIIKSSDLLAAKLISGETDFAVIPSNLAAIMFNKGAGFRLAGPVIWGLSYVVTSEDLTGWDDLRGREVSMIGRGLTPDITFRYLLKENGLDPDKDLEIVYASSASELVPTFLTGRSGISMMPEPMLTTVLFKKPDTKIFVDIQKEWAKLFGSSYPQASLVVSGAFAAEHPDFTQVFIEAFSASVNAAIVDPSGAGDAVSALVPELNAGIIADAIPRMNLDFQRAGEAKAALEDYYRVLEAFNPATIGGKMPTDDFYLP